MSDPNEHDPSGLPTGKVYKPVGAAFGFLDPKLEALADSAMAIFAVSSGQAYKPEQGLLGQLRACREKETDAVRRQHIDSLLNDVRTYFFVPSHDRTVPNHSQIRVTVTPDGLNAYLTVTPPRGSGNMPSLPGVLTVLQKARITHGIDIDVVNRALILVHERVNDLVWQAPVARGEPPIMGRPAHVDYEVRVLNKNELRTHPESLVSALAPHWDPVKEGTVIGRIVPATVGVSGQNVYGEPVLPDVPPDLGLKFGEDLKQTRGLLVAQCVGYPIVDEDQVYITPMYVIDHPPPGALGDFSFSGAVLVRGDLRGPGSVECEDLFLLGNCEFADIHSGGDVFMSGGFSGHHKSVINADGAFYAAFINEAELSALGEVVVANAIVGSRVVSNDSVRVTSDRGIIAGGTIQALRGVIVQTLGSEFGMFTETVVGKDFLTSPRLGRIAEKIKAHEDNLRRIQELKQGMAKAHMRVEELPPEKQEIYINVLRKESQSQSEIRSLTRRKVKLSHHLREFIAASVQVLDGVYPPLRVQIGDEIKEITDRLDAVTMQYDAGRVVVTAGPPKEKQEHS